MEIHRGVNDKVKSISALRYIRWPSPTKRSGGLKREKRINSPPRDYSAPRIIFPATRENKYSKGMHARRNIRIG